MVKAQFDRDLNMLRGLIKEFGCEDDPYKAIILVERYILTYGMKITRETVKFVTDNTRPPEDILAAMLDVSQTNKTEKQLFIYQHGKSSITGCAIRKKGHGNSNTDI